MNTRSGNALVLAFGVVSMIATLVVISATSATTIVESNTRRMLQLRCVAATEAVLQRREAAILAMATDGSILTWTGEPGQPGNYGEDIVGGCRVRWRIEPMRTLVADEAPGAPAPFAYVGNPSPDVTAVTNDTEEIQNSVVYLYRVAAEAAIVGPPDAQGARHPIARAQGSRAVSIINQPLFRYVIFYAAEGPKGDLELSHGPALNISGSVYSNGAIYMGANVFADDWGALLGGSGSTTISGVGARPARVSGIDGIYRMAKPIAYAFYNDLPITSGTSLSTVTDAEYDLTTVRFPNEATAPDLSSFAAATNNGRNINPRRIKSATGLITAGAQPRTINGVELSSDDTTGNDSRDLERPAARSWTTTSSTDFQRLVQSADTGALKERVDPAIAGAQALETQQLVRVDTDGDPTTDEHAAYRPQFFAADGTMTLALPTGQPVEVPGTYMDFALGGGLAMRRRVDHSGWTITTPTGGAAGAVATSALIIRERPIPDTALWPGAGVTMQPLPPNHPDYLPYAYGKHWRPALLPVTPIDITENLHDTNNNNAWAGIRHVGSSPITQRTESEPSYRQISYANGTVSLIGAARVPSDSTENVGATMGATGQSYPRRHRFHRDNWRFAHVQTRHGLTDAQILAQPEGLRAWVWDNANQGVAGLGAAEGRNMRLVGAPLWSGIDEQVNSATPWSPNAGGNPVAPATPPTGYFTIRWDGYLIAPTQGEYLLRLTHDDGCRIWVDDQLIYERWNTTGSNIASSPVQLSPNRPARIVIDYWEHTGSELMTLAWRRPDAVTETIPAANLRAAPEVAGFDRQNLSDVVMKVDLEILRSNPSALTAQKAGIMIREGFGAGNMLNGRDRYLFLGVSPQRGIFIERRMQPSRETVLSSVASDFWVHTGRSRNPPVTGAWVDASAGGLLGVPTDRNNATYDVERTSLIRPVVNPPTTLPVTVENVSNNVSTTVPLAPTAYSGPPIQLDESASLSGFSYGPWQKSATRTLTSREQQIKQAVFELQFDTYAGVFPPPPYAPANRPTIRIFNDINTTTTTSVEYTWNTNTYNVAQKTYGGIPNRYYLSRTVDGPALTGDSASKTSPSPTTTGTTSTNYLWFTGTLPTGWTPAAIRTKLNEINFEGRSDWEVGDFGGGVAKEPSNPTPPALTFTLAELPDLLGTPADPDNPFNDTNLHSFSVDVSNTYTVRVDNNSFISRTAVWSPVDVAQNRPWQTTWTSSYGLPFMMTRAFRPDLWWDATTVTTPLTAIQAESATAPLGGNPAAPPYHDDVVPAGWGTASAVWLRMAHDPATGEITFTYADGDDPDDPGSVGNPWQQLTLPAGTVCSLGAPDASVLTATDTVWNRSLLIGPAIQSGSNSTAMRADFSDVALTTTQNIGNNDGVWDRRDMENGDLPGVASATSRYLASQYQVFYANQDITEDFFSWADQVGGAPLAQEDWFYQTREFWSQNRRWSSGEEKDLVSGVYSNANTTNRQLFAKTTVLRLNLQRIFQYLTTRTLFQATTAIMAGDAAPAPAGDPLVGMFNGLIYAARTNRYPVNPSMEAAPTVDVANPWSVASGSTLELPNGTAATRYANLHEAVAGGFFHNGVHKLQPYGLPAAPPMRPQEFHHGVMLENGADINWGAFAPGSPLGTGATSIVTPNALYLRGNFNSVLKNVAVPNVGVQPRPVPVAVMGDSITLLSNSFTIENYQVAGFASTDATASGAGILALSRGRSVTTNATYNTAIVTYNQPSTLDRVRERQSAAFIDTMQYLENWFPGTQRTMNYTGSLVVLGTRRYTEAFLLNNPKPDGRSIFNPPGGGGTWTGQTREVYSAPSRVMNYNEDLLTPQGTPPFTPNGVTTASLGGWVRIIQ